MKRINKKGFTLIEMMVVVAIVAVLAAVIIPVTGKAVVKAKAATNAANLRSYQAEMVIKEQTGSDDELKVPKFYRIDGVGNGKGLNDEVDPITYDGLDAEGWADVSNGIEVTVPTESE